MDIWTIILIVIGVVVLILLLVAIVVFLLVWKTIHDVIKITEAVEDISGNIKKKKLSEALENPVLREKVIELVSSRFGILAPIASFFIGKFIYKGSKIDR